MMITLRISVKQLFLGSTIAIAVGFAFASNASADVGNKLSDRKTINPFAWSILRSENQPSDYGLVWGFPPPSPSRNLVTLTHISWELQRKGSHYADFKGNKPFLLDYSFLNPKRDNNAEYGADFATNHVLPNFPEWLAERSLEYVAKHKSDGVMLDWWHNNHPSNFSKTQTRSSRIKIAQELRTKLGSGAIIMGNVNQDMDRDTVKFINGVFMESWKANANQGYTQSELSKIEKAIIYYEKNLLEPKIIALEGWRRFSDLSDTDMNSSENRKMAKLFTAMSVVIPKNGYILFGDNNSDNPNNDHDHLLYDFYKFDIGKPVSGRIEIKNGAGYKEHQEGFIAYNITNGKQSFTRSNGETVDIEAKSGLFCRNVGASSDCLSYD
jgi:hypothetical protein